MRDTNQPERRGLCPPTRIEDVAVHLKCPRVVLGRMLEDARRALEEGASVMEVFLREARSRLADVERILGSGFPGPEDEALADLHRHAHTFKGLGSSLDLPRVEDVARELVLRLRELERKESAASEEERREVVEGFGRLREAVSDAARAGGYE